MEWTTNGTICTFHGRFFFKVNQIYTDYKYSSMCLQLLLPISHNYTSQQHPNSMFVKVCPVEMLGYMPGDAGIHASIVNNWNCWESGKPIYTATRQTHISTVARIQVCTFLFSIHFELPCFISAELSAGQSLRMYLP